MKGKTIGLIIVILMLIALVIIVILLWPKFCCGPDEEGIAHLDQGVKLQVNDLFGEEDKKLVIFPEISRVKQGTENYGIAIGFAPDNPIAWGSRKDGCKYTIEAVDEKNYCINKGWNTPTKDIPTGYKSVMFDEIDGNNGYDLIKINIPEDIEPCLQRFQFDVGCTGYPNETTRTYFDIEVIEKGVF